MVQSITTICDGPFSSPQAMVVRINCLNYHSQDMVDDMRELPCNSSRCNIPFLNKEVPLQDLMASK